MRIRLSSSKSISTWVGRGLKLLRINSNTRLELSVWTESSSNTRLDLSRSEWVTCYTDSLDLSGITVICSTLVAMQLQESAQFKLSRRNMSASNSGIKIIARSPNLVHVGRLTALTPEKCRDIPSRGRPSCGARRYQTTVFFAVTRIPRPLSLQPRDRQHLPRVRSIRLAGCSRQSR